jgi:hypothetical protein
MPTQSNINTDMQIGTPLFFLALFLCPSDKLTLSSL